MARQSNIERYSLQRVTNDLLAPRGDGTCRTLGEMSEELTRRARQAALRENPEMAPSLLDEVKVTPQAILRYKERSGTAAKRIIERNERMATTAAEATLNGVGRLVYAANEAQAVWEARKRRVGADKDANKLADIDTLDVNRLLSRMETSAHRIIQLELLGTDPALFATFLRILEKGANELFGDGSAERLKEWLQEQDEFETLAMALGWTKPDEESPPADGQGTGGVVN